MEKFNFEVNVRVLVPLRMLLNFLEAGNWLDKDNAVQVGAFAAIACSLMQVGLDRLKAAWNEHYVASKRGRPGSGGRPSQRMVQRPHPALQMSLPAGFDGVASWNTANMAPLTVVPDNAGQRDRHHQNAQIQHARALGTCPHQHPYRTPTHPTLVCSVQLLRRSWAMLRVLGTRFCMATTIAS